VGACFLYKGNYFIPIASLAIGISLGSFIMAMKVSFIWGAAIISIIGCIMDGSDMILTIASLVFWSLMIFTMFFCISELCIMSIMTGIIFSELMILVIDWLASGELMASIIMSGFWFIIPAV